MSLLPTDDFEPEISEFLNVLKCLENGQLPELEWKSNGYRPLTPVKVERESENVAAKAADTAAAANNQLSADIKQKLTKVCKTDFDFDDDEIHIPKLSEKGRKKFGDGPKGSAKKRTTSLDSVLSSIGRHYQIPKRK